MKTRRPGSPRRRARGINRREALRRIGAVAGAAAFSPLLSACGGSTPVDFTDAEAVPLEPEDLEIETLVIIMMENRSFDHYFGSRRLDEGRAVDGLRAGFSNPGADVAGSLDAFDVDHIRRRNPRPFPALPVLDVDPDVPPECLPFTSGAAAQDIAAFRTREESPRTLTCAPKHRRRCA